MQEPAAAWTYLPVGAAPVERSGATTAAVARLDRRGVDHGTVLVHDTDPPLPDQPEARWLAGTPIHLPGVLATVLDTHLPDALATWHAFERFRKGDRLLTEVEARLADDAEFQYAGSTVDVQDRREIEKVFVDVPGAVTGGRRVRDLTLKLSWIADDESDPSMRIRCSFGHEATRDWLAQDVRAAWSDRLTARVFPETRAVTEDATIAAFLADVLQRPHRLSECIVYSNAPGGGAMFHHDADPGQRGVVFAQILGVTVWLAVPRRTLAELATHHATVARLREPAAILAAMDGPPDADLWTLLNATPSLTADLANLGCLFVVRGGDAILLPSIDAEVCAWHSVFGVGTQPSLALSFGIFDGLEAQPGLPPTA